MIPNKKEKRGKNSRKQKQIKTMGVEGKREVMKLNESQRGKKKFFFFIIYFFFLQINEKVIRRGVKWFSPSFAADDILFVSFAFFFCFNFVS